MAALVGANFTVAPARRVGGSRVSNKRSTVTRASAKDEQTTDVTAPVVNRRAALSAVTASVASLAAASPAFAGLFDGLELPSPAAGDVKAKREINLPKLEVDPISQEEGYPLTNGGEKGRAQQQYLRFIEPIINESIDLPFQDYMRLALHDAGSYNVVGKKNGANGSIRFELDRPENADCKEAFASIEKIKKKIDAAVNQPISWADVIAIVPHYAARQTFAKDYYEVMGPDDPNYEFLFVGTNPYLGAKVRIGRRDSDSADPEGLVPGSNATCDELTSWFKRMGLGPNQLCMFAPYLYKGDEQKGIDVVSEDGINRAVLDQYASQRKLGKRAPGPAVTIIKNFKVMTDNCIPGGNKYVGGDRDPPYVEYARIRGGGEIPRVTTFGAFPGSADIGSSKFAQKVRGDR
ncbi:peroxidase family protein [bacterium]|nr:peroxidase family protein [bacterium]|tara:strand:+ start:10086 stop:11303 length:1218 start_codon:yes stop_codon:yes gene_type:complete